MILTEEVEKGVAEIVSGLQCSKNFQCYLSGFESLCKAKNIGMKRFLLCQEGEPRYCQFSIRFGGAYFCECPLRFYIAKKLNK